MPLNNNSDLADALIAYNEIAAREGVTHANVTAMHVALLKVLDPRPIATAPKDPGIVLLLWDPVLDEWLLGRWNDALGGWREEITSTMLEPTYWAHLPARPADDPAQRG